MKYNNLFYPLIILGIFNISTAEATQVKVTITNNAVPGGVAITPVWVGFHNGSFDSYDGGSAAGRELESLAEDGSTAAISAAFSGNRSLINTTTLASGTRVQGVVGTGPLTAGNTASAIFNLSGDLDNQYFSYASMILPSSDYFIANGNPFEHSLESLFANGQSITFIIGANGSINDAGTEINDFSTSAGNGLFPGLPDMQSSVNIGQTENGVVHNVDSPYENFLNAQGIDLSDLDFNSSSLYPNGVATVTISAVPVPATLWLMGTGLIGLASFSRSRNNS